MDSEFRQKVLALVTRIPKGKVMTYGDIALFCGQPYAARQVGGIAHWGPDHLPWHRVVNRFGDCAAGYPGGMNAQQKHLEAEGVTLEGYRITNFGSIRWWPHQN